MLLLTITNNKDNDSRGNSISGSHDIGAVGCRGGQEDLSLPRSNTHTPWMLEEEEEEKEEAGQG